MPIKRTVWLCRDCFTEYESKKRAKKCEKLPGEKHIFRKGDSLTAPSGWRGKVTKIEILSRRYRRMGGTENRSEMHIPWYNVREHCTDEGPVIIQRSQKYISDFVSRTRWEVHKRPKKNKKK